MLCIFHASCADGFAAATVVYTAYPEADFHATNYKQDPPDVDGLDVIIADFSYPKKVLLDIKQKAKSLVVLDHHKTAQKDLEGLDFCTFDMTKCGSVLTWEYLYPDKDVPIFLEYIQDRDLWKWELPSSKEVSACIKATKFDLDIWSDFLSSDFDITSMINDGKAIQKYIDNEVESTANRDNIPLVNIGGYKVPCQNCTHLVSEVCGTMAKEYPFAAVYFDLPNNKRCFSLRSSKDGVDVSEIAKKYGGGGHTNAAGFIIDIPNIEVG